MDQTFFSSGVLHWDDDGTLGSDWVFRANGFKLFIAICVPMMAVTLSGWLYMSYRTWIHAKVVDRVKEALRQLAPQKPTKSEGGSSREELPL